MQNELQEVACDFCGYEEHRSIYKLKNSSIVECTNCNFKYLNPRISSQRIKEILQEWAKNDVLDDERLRIAYDTRTQALYRSYIRRAENEKSTQSKKMLDVGCASGAFLYVAKSLGWDVTGLEIGEASSEYARNKGINVINASIFDDSINIEAATYDVVVFLEVIEHLEHPKRALEMIYSWLKPGGVLILSTPNFNSLFRRIHKTKWWVINCEEEHIMFFTPESLSAYIKAVGFKVTHRIIRGIDLPGIFRNFKSKSTEITLDNDYYSSRSSKEKFKSILSRAGLLWLVRKILNVFDTLSSMKYSPFYAMGEQLVFFAKKQQK